MKTPNIMNEKTLKAYMAFRYIIFALIATILALLTFACSPKPVVIERGTRVEVHEKYMKKYGNDPIKWKESTRKQYDIDMNAAKAE